MRKLVTREQMARVVQRLKSNATTITYEAHRFGVDYKTMQKYVRHWEHPDLGPESFPSEEEST